jgi:hypothetical protein
LENFALLRAITTTLLTKCFSWRATAGCLLHATTWQLCASHYKSELCISFKVTRSNFFVV